MNKGPLNLYCKCKSFNFRRFFQSDQSPNAEILSDLLGLNMNGAKSYIAKHKMHRKDGELMAQCVNYCKSLGFTNEEIINTPSLLHLHPLELNQHYLSMEEGGFKSIGPSTLARARTHMKQIINELKLLTLIPKRVDVPQSFLSFIEDKNIASKIHVQKFNSGDFRWSEVHLHILQDFLKHRLNASEDEIIRLFRIHKMIKNKSFRIIQENIALAEELGFETRKLLKYGYLLSNYPKYTKTVLKEFPNLAGTDMKKAMRQYPKLVLTSPRNMLKTYGILKEFDIEDDVIRKKINVLHLSPETVRLRLQEIERSPDLKVLLKHPGILYLVVHHNRAKSRLSFLQQLQLKCASLMVLGSNDVKVFDDYIKEGKDKNSRVDVMTFLQHMFGANLEQIKLKISRHPFYLHVPLKEMQIAYEYLRSINFQKANIFKIMHIILYPVDKIADALNELKFNKEFDYGSLSQEKKLNLVLYHIEKQFHFTGNGVWRKEDQVPDRILE